MPRRRSSESPAAHPASTSAAVRLARLDQADRYLLSLIQGPATPEGPLGRQEAARRGRERLARMRRLLLALGDPQAFYPVVHIAGTSGKGSVCAFVASICGAAGLRTGWHLSPYLQSPLEKLGVGERLASPEEFCDLVEWIRSRNVVFQTSEPELQPRYGSAWIALTFEYFRRNAVDLAVVETGVGGRFDLTNVVRPVVAAVTSVGLDHLATLGPTLADVAYHKAGVFKPGVPAIAIDRNDAATARLLAHAANAGAGLRLLREGADFYGERMDGDWPSLHYHGHCLHVDGVQLGLQGIHQLHNAAVACAVAEVLADLGYPITSSAVATGLRRARLAGRFEVLGERPPVVLDGAHNPDKAAALAASLKEFRRGRRLALVLGVLGYKSVEDIVDWLTPLADFIVATEPTVYQKASLPAAELMTLLRARGLPAAFEPDPSRALDLARGWAGPDNLVCVTGSLYLVGQIRERWYSSDRIALEGTSWPTGALRNGPDGVG